MLGAPDQTYVRALATAAREDTAKIRASRAALASVDRFERQVTLDDDVVSAIEWIAERSASEASLGHEYCNCGCAALSLFVR